MPKRTYGQYCALARTLDVVGDRWTLLVVRELLAGPKRYTDVLEALPGIGTTLLIERLRGLQGDRIVVRHRLPPPAASDVYELTPLGLELAHALVPLVAWGARHLLGSRAEGESFRAEWPLLALATTADTTRVGETRAVYQFEIDGSVAHLRLEGGRLTVHPGEPPDPADVSLAMTVETFVGVGSGQLTAADAIGTGLIRAVGDPSALAVLMEMISDIPARFTTP